MPKKEDFFGFEKGLNILWLFINWSWRSRKWCSSRESAPDQLKMKFAQIIISLYQIVKYWLLSLDMKKVLFWILFQNKVILLLNDIMRKNFWNSFLEEQKKEAKFNRILLIEILNIKHF